MAEAGEKAALEGAVKAIARKLEANEVELDA